MTLATLVADVTVGLAGAGMVLAPVISKPTVPFGVRVPPERTVAPAIRVQRRAYAGRTLTVVAACTAAAFSLPGGTPWWAPRLILVLELFLCLTCVQLARRQIIAVKQAEHWFAGHRQAVVADTGWRASPPRFPVRWLLPALAVIAATVATGLLRYPDLPAYLAMGAGRVLPKSPASAFAPVIGQAFVTALWTGVLLLACRARPDLDAADPAASAERYRAFVSRAVKAMLTLVACVDVTLLLSGLRDWRVLPLSHGAGTVELLPLAVGLGTLLAVAVRTGQGGYRLAPAGGAWRAAHATATADRDDDRFWKAGLFYVNRDDPALMVAKRFGAGWTVNFGNRVSWLLVAALVGTPVGLTVLLSALHA
jgi:uncharacterized membrane protein